MRGKKCVEKVSGQKRCQGQRRCQDVFLARSRPGWFKANRLARAAQHTRHSGDRPPCLVAIPGFVRRCTRPRHGFKNHPASRGRARFLPSLARREARPPAQRPDSKLALASEPPCPDRPSFAAENLAPRCFVWVAVEDPPPKPPGNHRLGSSAESVRAIWGTQLRSFPRPPPWASLPALWVPPRLRRTRLTAG